MEAAIIIGAIVNVVTLIVFFVMASNVARIKNSVLNTANSAEEYINMAHKEKYIGNRDKAKEYLLRARYMYEIENKGCYTEWDSDSLKTVDVSEKLINKVDQLLSEL